MKIYVAGPITGVEGYRQNFEKACEYLVDEGYEVASPTWFDAQGEMLQWGWNEYMRATIQMMLNCDGVALLDGWEKSKGAQVEVDLANKIGIPVHDLTDWTYQGEG